MKISPINFLWRKVEVIVDEQTGEVVRAMAMVPAPRYANAAAKQFAEGEEYTLDQIEERSMASHKQYFAALNSGYKNLPDNVGFRKKNDGSFELDLEGNRIPTWPSVKHYRKWLLIETGWYIQKEIAEANATYAKRLAIWIRNDIGEEAEYWRIGRNDNVVVIRIAKSQAKMAMKNKKEFEASKRDVLALNDSLTNVAPGTHWREAGNAA